MMSEFEKENIQFKDDLDWLAFCFVANELEGTQLEQFEMRVAEDQAARDAVVRAMELASAVYRHGDATARPMLATQEQLIDRTNRRRFWNSTVLWRVAALLLVAVSFSAWFWLSDGEGESKLAENDGEDLAIEWVDSLNDTELMEVVGDFTDEFGFEDDSESEWLLVALSELENSKQDSTN